MNAFGQRKLAILKHYLNHFNQAKRDLIVLYTLTGLNPQCGDPGNIDVCFFFCMFYGVFLVSYVCLCFISNFHIMSC